MPVAVEVLYSYSDPRGLQGMLLRICRPTQSYLPVQGYLGTGVSFPSDALQKQKSELAKDLNWKERNKEIQNACK